MASTSVKMEEPVKLIDMGKMSVTVRLALPALTVGLISMTVRRMTVKTAQPVSTRQMAILVSVLQVVFLLVFSLTLARLAWKIL